ncbi:CLUMA_CG001308, isoform A [Clunio marinus]|uniref:CLUMA_CG001308, isoform A n=1 Tax=Clunio marinus TaxID=568069 RepID=A0A1J1HHY6_9DIPT|nr:CLUMA_CG001308, isoform A [Clunio marinus]
MIAPGFVYLWDSSRFKVFQKILLKKNVLHIIRHHHLKQRSSFSQEVVEFFIDLYQRHGIALSNMTIFSDVIEKFCYFHKGIIQQCCCDVCSSSANTEM